MKSYQVIAFGQPLTQTVRDTPNPKDREVLVRVSACGVCHSDVHIADGYFDLGGGRKADLTKSVAPPRTPGHEIVGEVVAVGPSVTAADNTPIGARRLVYPWIGCGACALCTSGQDYMCNAPRAHGINTDGGFADHVLVPDARFLLAFDPVSEDQACTLACSGLTAYGALKKAKAPGSWSSAGAAGGDVLIIGAGGVGLSGTRLAQAVLGRAPIVADIDASKFDAAMKAGAKRTIDPSAPTAIRELMAATAGGAAVAIDFVGAGASFAFGMNALRKGGKLIVVGLFGGATPISPSMIVLKGLTIEGSYVGSLEDMRELLALARKGGFPDLPVQTRPLADINAVLAELKSGKIVGRTVVKPAAGV